MKEQLAASGLQAVQETVIGRGQKVKIFFCV
jgi:hypothetical protein